MIRATYIPKYEGTISKIVSHTGYVYDEYVLKHERKKHDECPERVSETYNFLEKPLKKCKKIVSRKATPGEIMNAHTIQHYNLIKSTSFKNTDIHKLEQDLIDVFFNKYTFKAALIAAGSFVELCDQIVNGQIDNGIAIIRPPGHHARSSTTSGYCIFNNVAIAASTMIQNNKLSKIVILDLDIHHGDGTEEIFIKDDNVLYISIHLYNNGDFFPRTGHPNTVGTGKNVNIALNKNEHDKIGDKEYIFLFHNLIEPIIKEYGPELIILSAGFDCIYGDQYGDLDVKPGVFFYIVKCLRKINSKVAIAMEGGYNLEAIKQSMNCCLLGLMCDISKLTKLKTPEKNITSCVLETYNLTKSIHKKYWKCLNQMDMNKENQMDMDKENQMEMDKENQIDIEEETLTEEENQVNTDDENQMDIGEEI